MSAAPDWFADWFNSPWYPILYDHRDEEEAWRFIARVLQRLALPGGSHILDLACGSGRHAAAIQQAGYSCVGVDLAPDAIAQAQEQYAGRAGLSFLVADMRSLPFRNEFHAVLNLFTSFGYFNSMEENLRVLQNAHRALQADGWLVIDFLNAERVERTLVPEETLEKQGITFNITRHIEDGQVVKRIRFVADGQSRSYEERVQLLRRPDFDDLFEQAGFAVQEVWGDYEGGVYIPPTSPRQVLFARRVEQ